jgi:hypothetical protein
MSAGRINWMLLAVSVAVAGCDGGPTAVAVPPINAAAVGAGAIKDYDKNGDGKLDATELDGLPACKGNMAKFDTDGDKALTAQEIQGRVQKWLDAGVGLISFQCIVTMDGKPLENATIELIPENCMGGSIEPCEGKTNSQGMAVISIAADKLPADLKTAKVVRCGLYKVKVIGAGVPAKYNTATTLGQEIAPDTSAVGIINYALKSK